MHSKTPATGHPDRDLDTRRRELAAALDGALHAAAAPLTGGLSPISLLLAQTDWALHLATQPAQSLRLAMDAQRGLLDVCTGSLGSSQPPPGPSSEDLRFSHPAWQQWPYATWVQVYRAAEAWWKDATALRGMTAHHQELARVFGGNLDVANPVEPETMRYKSLVSIVRDEWRQTARLSWRSIYARLFSIFASVLMFALRIKPMGYDPEPYRKALRTHSDFRKFDGVLRMVIDCTDEEKARIVAMLEASAARGQLAYGVHGSRTALMTCYVRGMRDGQHIHFIDGANGGYAMAAKGLKAQRG